MIGKLHRKYTRNRQGLQQAESLELSTREPPGRNYKKTWLHKLTALDKINIVNEVIIEKYSQKDTARKFRVSVFLVNQLLRKVKDNHNYLKEQLSAQEDQKDKKKR